MKRIAALYDIHGNLPALEAVLAEVQRAGVDGVLVGGDVFPGPMAFEALDLLLGLDVPTAFLHGNGDRVVLERRAGVQHPYLPETAQEAVEWTARHLDPVLARMMAEWPSTVSMTVEQVGDVLFCHATPRNDTEVFLRTTADDRVARAFAGVRADVAACGHTHMAFDRTVGLLRIVNAGSVGMPFGRRGADWLLLGPGVELRHTDYDFDAAAARIRATAFPGAETFAAREVLNPQTEAEMLALFERAELK